MKVKKFKTSIIVFIITFILFNVNIFAVNVVENLKEVPITEEYKEWEKSESKDNNGYIPKKYNVGTISSVLGNSNNPYYIENLSQYANLSKFSLKDVIPENTVIRDQKQENSCWAFSTMACLESNLALKNKQRGAQTKVYDFSEQYMVSSSFYDNFLNGKKNLRGLGFKPYEGGTFSNRAIGNVSSGFGVVNEEDYPYLNSENAVDISTIDNKKMKADILNTITFMEAKTDEEQLQLRKSVKEHIVSNGGVYVSIKIPDMNNFDFNPSTGAVNNNTKVVPNHAITIIGWDDNYSKDNFANKPKNNGAWIAKNSYGDHMEEDLNVIKRDLYEAMKSFFNQNNIYSSSAIPDDVVINALNDSYNKLYGIKPVKLITVDSKKYCSIEFGNGGYLYVSYEDKTLKDFNGIVRSVESKDYDNLYQNYYAMSTIFGWTQPNINPKDYRLFIAEQYEKKSDEELLIKFSIFVPLDADYEFLANVNDDEIKVEKFNELVLENSEKKIHLKTGYNTVYLKEPLKINSNKFAVAARVANGEQLYATVGNTPMANVIWFNHFKPTGKSYLGIIDNKNEMDLVRMTDYDFTLKAYTKKVGGNQEQNRNITKIEVKTLPNKREYLYKKESLNLYGGELKVYYDNGNTEVISMTDSKVSISGFDNNNLGNNVITVKYENYATNFTVLIKEEKSSEGVKNNSINDVKFTIFNLGNNKKIRIGNIKLYNENTNYEYSIILKDSSTNKEEVLTKKNGENKFNFTARDLKQDNDGSYYYELIINENDVKNIDALKRSDLLVINLKEYVDNIVNEKTSKLDFVKDNKFNNKDKDVDNTVSKGRLPQTGEAIWIFTSLIVLLSGCIIYKVYTKKIK